MHQPCLGRGGITALLSLPAFADNLVTNGSFEDNFGAGQFNQTLPGSAGGQSGGAPGTTATDLSVTGTNSSYPEGYAFIFGNANSFTTTNSGVGPTSQYGNPGGPPTLPLWGAATDESPAGNYFYGVDSTFHPSALSQVIGGLTVGDQYTLKFEYAAAQQYLYNGYTTDQWVATLGGQTIATTSTNLASNGFSGWMTDTVTFTYEGLGPNPNLLTFVDNGMGGCNSSFLDCAINDPGASGGPPFSLLDNVSLSPSVPEVSTWTMMLAGFAGLGYAGFRRRRRPAISIA